MKIFGGRSNPRLAEEIGVRLGVGLGPVTLRSFSGGEVYCRYEESIRGSDVFLIQ
jgi:ribose-phosphate pyrophosphokinase